MWLSSAIVGVGLFAIGALEAALAGDDFADLVAGADIEGMVHCHTTHSDGRASIEEMARAAQAMGMSDPTITDHSPLASYAGGLTVEGLRATVGRDRGGAGAGAESASCAGPSAGICWPTAPSTIRTRCWSSSSVIIGSVHNRFHLDEEEMTRRLVRAMRLPVFKIWGHPLGRLLLRREPLACRMDEVLDAIASSNRAAIEINGDHAFRP